MRAAVKAQKEKKVEMNQLAVRLRELEQEERITEFKFRDVKRQMRHNHLKPISRAGSEVSRKSSIMSAQASQSNLKTQTRSGSMAPAAKKKPAAAPKSNAKGQPAAKPAGKPAGKPATKAPAKATDQPKKINAKKAAKPAAKPQRAKKELGDVKGGTYKTETILK